MILYRDMKEISYRILAPALKLQVKSMIMKLTDEVSI